MRRAHEKIGAIRQKVILMIDSPRFHGTQTAILSTGGVWKQCAVLTVALLLQTGCRVTVPRLLQPPGHLYHQRLRATHFDPYADVDAGPEVAGGRPRSYERPRAQAEKAQWFLDAAGE